MSMTFRQPSPVSNDVCARPETTMTARRMVMTWRHSTMLSTSQTLSFLFMSLLFYSPIHWFLSQRR